MVCCTTELLAMQALREQNDLLQRDLEESRKQSTTYKNDAIRLRKRITELECELAEVRCATVQQRSQRLQMRLRAVHSR